MPDWAVTLATVVITAITTYIVAPIVAKILRRRRDDADTGKVIAETQTEKAQTDKVRAETRLLKISEIDAKITTLVEKAVYGASDFIEHQRAEIKELRQRSTEQDHKIAIMNETISTMIAQIRRLELAVEQGKVREDELHKANLRLLEQVGDV